MVEEKLKIEEDKLNMIENERNKLRSDYEESTEA
jgi:hypothetical protein